MHSTGQRLESRSKYLEPLISHLFRTEEGAAKLRLAAAALDDPGASFQPELVDLVLAGLRQEQTSAALLKWAEELPRTVNTGLLIARLCTEAGEVDKAAEAWLRVVGAVPQCDEGLRLEYARALHACGRISETVHQLQIALKQPHRYAFFPRAEKLIQAVAGQTATNLRHTRIAVLGTKTTSPLIGVLRAYCLRDRIAAEIYQGLYGSVQQEILDPNSGLATFRPSIVFLVTHWRDFQLPPITQDEKPFIEAWIEERLQLWKRLSGQFACHIVQFACDFPAEEAYGYLAGSLAGGRTRLIEHINIRLREIAPPYVSILDTTTPQREVGLAHWEDPVLWHNFQQHPSTEGLPALANRMAAHLRAVLGLSRKVLVTDLDNTLWKGVIGEDGLDGIQIGPGSVAGEAHLQLQQYLLDLKSRGILLAVCSKNNPGDARLPFEKHPQMLLRLQDFAAFEANWNDKATNLINISRQLSLGLDSFVMLDDSAVEREWIRSQLPDVAVPEIGPSPLRYVAALDREYYFFSLNLSTEDQDRASQYESESIRQQILAVSESLNDFLERLQMQASVMPISSSNLRRVTQLVNKTNQFNLTTRRYTEAQVQQMAANHESWAGAFHLSDRMGDYGLIGVLFCKPTGEDAEWEVDTWLMSCRALGREMENFMFDRLVEAAQQRAIRRIVGIYQATAKNKLVADLYPRFGFTPITSASSDQLRYVLYVPEGSVRAATHIHDVSVRSLVQVE
jgi:FkbH-like protein